MEFDVRKFSFFLVDPLKKIVVIKSENLWTSYCKSKNKNKKQKQNKNKNKKNQPTCQLQDLDGLTSFSTFEPRTCTYFNTPSPCAKVVSPLQFHSKGEHQNRHIIKYYCDQVSCEVIIEEDFNLTYTVKQVNFTASFFFAKLEIIAKLVAT